MSGLPGTLTQIFLHLIIIRVTGLLLLLGADQSFLLYLKSQSLLNFKTHATENYVSIEISSSSLISGSLHFSIPILWLLLLHKRERRRDYKGLLLLSGLMLFAPVEVKYQELTMVSNWCQLLISFFCQYLKLKIYLKFTSAFKEIKFNSIQWIFSSPIFFV